MIYIYSLLIACFVIALSGCSGSGTNSVPAPALTAPKVGSSFTYMNVKRDTNDVVTFTDTSVKKILQTNFAIGGMTDALLMEETFGNGTKDTSYVRFTSDGDVQLLSQNFVGSFLPIWLPLPFLSHVTHSYTGDTLIANGLFTEYDTTTVTLKYERTENVTVKGSAISSSVVSLTIASTYKQINNISTDYGSSTNSSEISFGTSIGWLTHQKYIVNVSNGKRRSKGEQTLIDYTLAK